MLGYTFNAFICIYFSRYSFPQKIAERPSPAYSSHNQSTTSSGSGGVGGYVYLQQQPCYGTTAVQQNYHNASGSGGNGAMVTAYSSPCNANGTNNTQQLYNSYSNNNGNHQNLTPTLHKKGSIRNNGDVLKRSRLQNG